MEGLHIVGVFLSEISDNCVLNYVLHHCLCVYSFGFFLCVLHVYFYYYSV
jgi:hypothetical protein